MNLKDFYYFLILVNSNPLLGLPKNTGSVNHPFPMRLND